MGRSEEEETFMYGMDRLSKFSDSVTHSWVIKYLELIGINNKIILFTKKTMSSWKSIVLSCAEEKLIGTEDTEVEWGMFESDSLSPLILR